MIRYALPAAVALALGASAALAQTTVGQPMPLTVNPMTTNASANGTIVGQPQPGPADTYGYAPGQAVQPYGEPMGMPPQPGMMPMGMVPVPAGSVWIPAHYNWDPHAQNYVWLEGEYAQPPRPGAQWVAGHWQQTPTAWVWVDGNWN